MILPLATVLATAIASIPITSTIVIPIVTIFVSFEIFQFTYTFAAALFCGKFGIQALACLAVMVLPLVAVLSAAIPVVPVATAIVVRVVAVFVAFVSFKFANA